MKGLQKGFTLIELMIVVAIIGILAAVAVPAYQDYTARAKVSEALTISEAVKLAIVDYAHENGGYPNGVDPLYETLGLPGPDNIEGDYVERIDIANDGTGAITATFRINMDDRLDGQQITLIPTQADVNGILPAGAWNWACGTGIESRFVPSQCRNPLNITPDGSQLGSG